MQGFGGFLIFISLIGFLLMIGLATQLRGANDITLAVMFMGFNVAATTLVAGLVSYGLGSIRAELRKRGSH